MGCKDVLVKIKNVISQKKRMMLGIIFILLVVFIWVGSSNLMQLIFSDSFENPFFTAYFSTSLFSVYFIGFLIFPSWRAIEFDKGESIVRRSNENSLGNDSIPVLDDQPLELNEETTPNLNHDKELQLLEEDEVQLLDESQIESIDKEEEKLPLKNIIIISLQFCFLWLLANYTFNFSLSKTSVSSSTIISTTSSFWTLVFCHIMKIERFKLKNLFAVLITIAGAIIINIADLNKGFGTILGNIIAAISAIFYGAYTTFLRWKIKNEKQVSMAMFFAFVGIQNMLLSWPIFFILHYSKLERFQIPSLRVIAYLLINGLVGTVLSDLLWSLCLLLTSPLLASIGITLTVPLAMIIDLILKKKTFHFTYIIGAIAVVIGFVLVAIFRAKTQT